MDRLCSVCFYLSNILQLKSVPMTHSQISHEILSPYYFYTQYYISSIVGSHGIFVFKIFVAPTVINMIYYFKVNIKNSQNIYEKKALDPINYTAIIILTGFEMDFSSRPNSDLFSRYYSFLHVRIVILCNTMSNCSTIQVHTYLQRFLSIYILQDIRVNLRQI